MVDETFDMALNAMGLVGTGLNHLNLIVQGWDRIFTEWYSHSAYRPIRAKTRAVGVHVHTSYPFVIDSRLCQTYHCLSETDPHYVSVLYSNRFMRGPKGPAQLGCRHAVRLAGDWVRDIRNYVIIRLHDWPEIAKAGRGT